MTSLLAHGVWLPLVLGHASVNRPITDNISSALVFPLLLFQRFRLPESHTLRKEKRKAILDNIGADGRGEDGGKGVGRARGLSLHRVNRDSRTRRHCRKAVVKPFVVVVGGMRR